MYLITCGSFGYGFGSYEKAYAKFKALQLLGIECQLIEIKRG